MKKSLIFIVIIGAGLTLGVLFTQTVFKELFTDRIATPLTNSMPNVLPNQDKEETTQPPQYSLDYFQQKDYPAAEITIEREVRATSGFTSYVVSYSSDTLKQYALMNVPNSDGPHPVVVVNHGYIPPDQYSTTQSYINTSAYFANQGFLVLKPDYRGHDQSETDGKVLSRMAYTDDVLALVHAIDSLEAADADRIYMYGHSMGGDITLKVLESSHKIKKATLWAPVAQEFPESIFYFVRKNRSSAQIMEYEGALDTMYSEDEFPALSPMNYLDRISAPLLIHHGTADASVPYAWSENLAKKLESAGVEHTFYTYPNDNHDIAANFTRALQRDVAFFQDEQERQEVQP